MRHEVVHLVADGGDFDERQVGVDGGDRGAQIGDGVGGIACGAQQDEVGEAVLIFFGRGPGGAAGW